MVIKRRISKGVTFHRLDNPVQCPGGYTLDMYCKYFNIDHGVNEFPHQFIGTNFSDTYAQARDAGWRLDDNNYGTCPKCNKFLHSIGTKPLPPQ